LRKHIRAVGLTGAGIPRLSLCHLGQTGLAGDGYASEKLGEPVRIPGLSIRCATQNAKGEYVAWAAQENPGGYAVVGVRVASGELVWLDTGKYDRSHIQMTTGVDGNFYFHTGQKRPGLRPGWEPLLRA